MTSEPRKRPLAPLEVTNVVPRGLRIAAAVSWRVAAVALVLYGLMLVAGYFATVLIPLGIALLLSALMVPAVDKLVDWRVPKGLSAAIVLVAGLGVIGGLLTFVISEFSSGLPQLQQQVGQSLDTIRDWLEHGPLHLRDEQIKDFINNIIDTIKTNQAAITSGALTTAVSIGEVLAGFILTLFILIFFLYDGEGIWSFMVRGVPQNVRERVDVAGRRSFSSLVSYVRATAAVAVVDAVGIGIGLAIVGVPLVVPLSALVFLGAFIPIIGAVIAGAVAVLVALVANGVIAALIVLAIVIGVMQLESHILQPWLLGRAVRLHPLAVVLAITAGLVAAGIPGALLAVPLLAVLNAGVRSLLSDRDRYTDADDVDVLDDSGSRPGARAKE
ncbi:AI-2E family transporter [Kibdelosporangium philippinense]|uniref:AI-2E family transporter n=1 Tax=Kibdelosporangium philippinense TaxID=211113 RepID=A0ABS8ZB70_9PSEU|nr:AI-2E family transporter [Kibdelosporangium philippinense]MCE7005123.1 AI-2E family transporter [Kibdelosporangium philippinense]